MALDGASEAPLKGLRVVELAQLLAGPYCGQLFADFGAEVIKVEQPGIGDPMREWGREKAAGRSLWWPIISRNKKSVTANLRETEGQELVRELIKSADVVIENFRPGTLERWDLGYERLSEENPGLIMIRVTGYGQSGPYAQRAGYGAIGEALGGLRYVTGDPSTPPSRTGISIGDTLAATFAAVGGLAALQARSRTGVGQVVDSAIYEAVFAVMEAIIPEYELGGSVRERTGSILPNIAPSNVYPTKDGELILIAANQDTVFRRLAKAMGAPELAEDPRYISHGARGEHQGELDELIASWSAKYSSLEVEQIMEEYGVPMGRMFRAPEMLADPHFAARDAITSLVDPILGEVKMQNVVPKLSKTPGQLHWTGPDLGAHNEEVYSQLLGLSQDRLFSLSEQGVI